MWSELFGNSRPSLSRSPRTAEFLPYCLTSTEILREDLQWLTESRNSQTFTEWERSSPSTKPCFFKVHFNIIPPRTQK